MPEKGQEEARERNEESRKERSKEKKEETRRGVRIERDKTQESSWAWRALLRGSHVIAGRKAPGNRILLSWQLTVMIQGF